MGFVTAVKTVFSKYVGFSGRARRSEYWWWALFTIIVSFVTVGIDGAIGTYNAETNSGLIQGIASLALFLPGLAVAFRRLHDTGRTGLWILLALIPVIGWIVLIVFFAIATPTFLTTGNFQNLVRQMAVLLVVADTLGRTVIAPSTRRPSRRTIR